MRAELTYQNPTSNALEVTLNLNLEKDRVVKSLMARIGDKEIDTEIEEMKKAKRKFREAMEEGRGAIIAESERDEKLGTQTIKITLGNLPAREEAKVFLEYVYETKMMEGHYHFKIPQCFYPDYSKHEVSYKGNAEAKFKFTYMVVLMGEKGNEVINTFAPSSATVETVEEGLEYRFEGTIDSTKKLPRKELNLFYLTKNMKKPVLRIQRSAKHKNEVAVMFSAVPCFKEAMLEPQEVIHENENDLEEMNEWADPKEFHYTFIVDRSGSMYGARIATTKKALKLFMQSLRIGCTFSIYSFGCYFKKMKINGEEDEIEYNELTLSMALEEIEKFDADMGTTNMADPIKAAFEADVSRNKRIFVLSDGEPNGGADEIIQIVKKRVDEIKEGAEERDI